MLDTAGPLRPGNARVLPDGAAMTSVTPLEPLVRRFHQVGALNSLINLYGFVDDQVFLTKSGDLGVVLGLDGVDYECLDTDQREAVSRRFEVALRVLDESMRVSQYVLKRHHALIPH